MTLFYQLRKLSKEIKRKIKRKAKKSKHKRKAKINFYRTKETNSNEGEGEEVEEEIETDNSNLSPEEKEKLKEGVLKTLEKAKEDVLEDLETEKQLHQYNRINDVNKKDFPLFLTVKKLVYMLDGDCKTSFFSRDNKGRIVGMNSSNEWHNESKEGALMINQYQRDTFDFDKTIKNIGREMIKAEDMDDEDKVQFLQKQGINVDEEELKELMDMKNVKKEAQPDERMSIDEFIKEKEKNENLSSGKRKILEIII